MKSLTFHIFKRIINYNYRLSNSFLNNCHILTIDSQWFIAQYSMNVNYEIDYDVISEPRFSSRFHNEINFRNKNQETVNHWFPWIWFVTVCIFYGIITEYLCTTSGYIYNWDFQLWFFSFFRTLFEQLMDTIVPAFSTQNVKFGFFYVIRWMMNNGTVFKFTTVVSDNLSSV